MVAARPVTANGTTLDCLDAGAGSAIVFLHGAPSDHRVWIPHAQLLADRYRVVAYSQRYFGLAPWNDAWPPFGVRSHADDLTSVLGGLGEPAHVVGWSYGAHVALTVAHEAPHLFRSLLLYEPGFPTYVTDAEQLAAFSTDANRMFGPVVAAVAGGDHAGAVRLLIDGSSGKAGYFAEQPLDRQRVQLDNARVIDKLLAQTPPPLLGRDDLARLRVPTTVTWGECTRPLFSIVSQAAANAIGGPRHRAVRGATHMWPEEDPAAFIACLLACLREPVR